MSRILPAAGLLAALLLLTATAGAAHAVTLNCTNVTTYTVDTTDKIQVGLDFESIGPVLPNAGVVYDSKGFVYGTVNSAQWDGPLNFTVTLDAYAPNQPWTIVTYQCVYNNSGYVETRYYDVVVKTPNRTSVTRVFTVPSTYAQYSASADVPVSKPLSGSYCSAPPDVYTWPRCAHYFVPDPNYFVSVSWNPTTWKALQVNGYKPGDVVKAYGVNATIPNTWTYGIYSNVGTLSSIWIGNNKYGPDATNVPVSSTVLLEVKAIPTEWGSVKLKGVSLPVYAIGFYIMGKPPTESCRPPSCFVLGWRNLTTVCQRDNGSKYVIYLYEAIAAIRTGDTLSETTYFAETSTPTVYLPLGSVVNLQIVIKWGATYLRRTINQLEGPYLRVIHDPAFYDEIAKKGKINGPFPVDWPNPVDYKYATRSNIALAVDESVNDIELAPYSTPAALPIRQPPYDRAIYGSVYLICDKWVDVSIDAPIWLTDALKNNYPDISGGRYVDLLHFLYGEPTTYYWGNGDQYGKVYAHTAPYYAGTTADSAGTDKLYYTVGVQPTDAAAFFAVSWGMPQYIGGDTGNNVNNRVTKTVSTWLVALVPTAACRSMFCTSLSPEILGPLPPFPGNRALPNTGYSIMVMYLGNSNSHRIKVYIEDGYVISSNPLKVSRARNYTLVEIDKYWNPFDAVIVGPGWWVPYQPLGPCDTMPVSASSIYATPDRTGPVKVVVEDNGVNSTYIFSVSDMVNYHIVTDTSAPESITATPFNITAYLTLGGVPYYHALYGYGEGGRLSPPTCASTWYNQFQAAQLTFSGDFWGSFGMANMLLEPVNIQYVYSKPRIELVDPWRGLVRVRADGPIVGFAFYAQRNGAWVKIGEVSTWVGDGYRDCVLVNASKIFPWDPILVLPLLKDELDAAPGSTVAIWRPETALLFKAWADLVGYPKGAGSELKVIGIC